MELREIINGTNILDTRGNIYIDIDNIQYDSRKVNDSSLFICIRGFKSDGHKYIENAFRRGVRAFLVEDNISDNGDIFIEGATFVRVKNTREDMAIIADNFYNHPSKKISVVGVTGTNGKTSISTLFTDVLKKWKKKSGLIGTIKIFDGENTIISNSTTPESVELQKYFSDMVANNCEYCAMEVSSHSLALNRVDETDFKVGIFTNLTPDHLDFHKDLEDYRQAKEKLFHKTSLANIINIDDDGGKKIYENIKNLKTKCYTYGISNDADFTAKNIVLNRKCVSYTLVTPTYEENICVPTPGMFNVYNSLAIIAACYVLDIPKEVYKEALESTKGVSGRFESVENDKDFSVIVDYAHTPDALENVLKTAKEFAKGKLICVFGCGGDRDSEKRPLMGAIAQKYADKAFITSDNPRTENPTRIIEDILGGIDKN
ncbi:MAG: UDP-N-acetylmuramoyl-L-alanyl-D-glutamate--2,6-diaminopimelate ligase, partial [Clostridioides sp.]|nr:UDP-N-acetylmuramoyl-L-alanyl-D-glutamate--2,6-diaminopimelate ligase [Clostridioides sp.]